MELKVFKTLNSFFNNMNTIVTVLQNVNPINGIESLIPVKDYVYHAKELNPINGIESPPCTCIFSGTLFPLNPINGIERL